MHIRVVKLCSRRINMTASTELLRDNLNIHFIDGTRTHINLIFIFCQYKRSLYSANIQQFIRRLCCKHCRTVNIAWTYCNRIFLTINFCIADCLSLCLIRCHIITEHLAYPCNICTASSQKCCCFKGSHTCTVHKVSRIDHNSGIHALCFKCREFDVIYHIL